MSRSNIRPHAAHVPKAESSCASGFELCELPSHMLSPESEQVRAMLEELDDVIFSAISGNTAAQDKAKVLWPKVVAEIGLDLVEESREQYLRYAIEAIRRSENDDVRSPEQVIPALEVISLLTTN
jgi:hypothetical protein